MGGDNMDEISETASRKNARVSVPDYSCSHAKLEIEGAQCLSGFYG